MIGKVYLVGAGAGNYGLLTLNSLKYIQTADVIVYDNLVNREILLEAKFGCETIYVGKVANNHTLTQDEINLLLVKKAKEGKFVVRLKGGDPYVFGRGAEEAQFLIKNNIDFEVVSGVSSALAGPMYAGIPLTHRDYSSSFHVITGHLKAGACELNWEAIANVGGTLVFLMGVANLKTICINLISNGMAKVTPVAVIYCATLPNQKVIVGTLDTIYKEETRSPSIIVVGEVVRLREQLNFFEKRPLFGKTIVVTRSRVNSSNLVQQLQNLGANVLQAPTIVIQKIENNMELDNSITNLLDYNYIIFTSQNAVDIFFARLFEKNLDCRYLSCLKVVVVGDNTKKVLEGYGICADIMPKNFSAKSLCNELATSLKKTDKILFPTAKNPTSTIQTELEKLGCLIDVIPVYETKIDYSSKEELLNIILEKDIDYITFTSSSTVKNFISLLGEQNLGHLAKIKLVSIGDTTTKTIQSYNLETPIQAKNSTIEDMINCIIEQV
ncbi:MAG: uroporphyrinogen-III C-methyltransferase [Epulopiscium sp. Nele67-Bin005]|nr:MAG: uroporphyrinogen-III C-methyltransferase [Epulopiscium sp. Nele67-Bin005]